MPVNIWPVYLKDSFPWEKLLECRKAGNCNLNNRDSLSCHPNMFINRKPRALFDAHDALNPVKAVRIFDEFLTITFR